MKNTEMAWLHRKVEWIRTDIRHHPFWKTGRIPNGGSTDQARRNRIAALEKTDGQKVTQ